jgi:hypothetical protein
MDAETRKKVVDSMLHLDSRCSRDTLIIDLLDRVAALEEGDVATLTSLGNLHCRLFALEEWRDKHCCGMDATAKPTEPQYFAQACQFCGRKAYMANPIKGPSDAACCTNLECPNKHRWYDLAVWNAIRFKKGNA